MEKVKRIIQVEPKNVIPLLCEGVIVYRINLEQEMVTNLDDKQLRVIRRDLDKDIYLYFIVDEEAEE